MSHKGHKQPVYNLNKNHAIVGRQDELLAERRHERFDPIELTPRTQQMTEGERSRTNAVSQPARGRPAAH